MSPITKIQTIIRIIIKMNWNHYLEETKNHLNKLKNNKLTYKDIDSIVGVFDNLLQAKLHISFFDKIIQYFIQFFVLALPHLPNEQIYRCFRAIIQCQSAELKSKKAYFLIKNIVQICQSSEVEEKNLKTILSLTRKASEKEYGAEIMNIFADYYLERLKEIEKTKNLNFKVLSQLASILISKYKHQASQIIRNYLGINDHFSIFLLVEAKQFPSLIFPFLQAHSKRLLYPRIIEENHEFKVHFLKLFHQLFFDMVRGGFFENLKLLSFMHPFKNTQHLEELLDEILLSAMKNPVLESKKEEIASSWKTQYQTQTKNMQNQQRLKLYVIVCYVFAHNSQIPKELRELSQFEEETMADYFNGLGLLGFNSDNFSSERIKKELIRSEKEREYLHYDGNMDIEGAYDFEDWKRLLSFVFQQINHYTPKKKEEDLATYPQLSYEAFRFYSIKPKYLQKNEESEIIFWTDAIFRNSLKILSKIVGDNDHLVVGSYIKKLMAFYYDKVNESVIKENIYNLFFCKCLMLTNNQIKAKIVFDTIIRMKEQNPQLLKKNLQMLIPSVSQRVIIQYGNYLASKDKCKFRMELFEKELTEFDYLSEVNLYEIIEPIYINL